MITRVELKQVADSFLSDVLIEEEKDNYTKEFFQHEGILLEKSKTFNLKNQGLFS